MTEHSGDNEIKAFAAAGGRVDLTRLRDGWLGVAARSDGVELTRQEGRTRAEAMHRVALGLRWWLRHDIDTAETPDDRLADVLPAGFRWSVAQQTNEWEAVAARPNGRVWARSIGSSEDSAIAALVERIKRARMDPGELGWAPETIPADVRQSLVSSWWGAAHDDLISEAIADAHWYWWSDFFHRVEKVTDPEAFRQWQDHHAATSQVAWYNHLNLYAVARAAHLGLLDTIRRPGLSDCLLCHTPFREDSLSRSHARYLGMDSLIACGLCLGASIYENGGRPDATDQEIRDYITQLSGALERIPPFRVAAAELQTLALDARVEVLKAQQDAPTRGRVRQLYGSWLGALVSAGVLEKGARETMRGTQSFARDGHLCLSLVERTIDDLLFELGIPHERERHYPEGKYRSDFTVGSTEIEYLGLAGSPEYDAKTRLKEAIASRHGMDLLLLRAEDVVDRRALSRRLLELATASRRAPTTSAPTPP